MICAIGSICSFTDLDGMKRFLEPYHDIPVILVGTKIDGYLCVTYDNKTGVSDGIRFLIEKRNCKNIGIISANASANMDFPFHRNRLSMEISQDRVPTLSTVHADGSLLGKEAVSMAKDLLEQKK